MAKEQWPHPENQWPQMDFGTILVCGSLEIKPPVAGRNMAAQQGRPNLAGHNRLLQIIISESAHLIWVLRCERVILLKEHGIREIKSRWVQAINKRLTEDKITTTKINKDKRTRSLIKRTWEPLLKRTVEINSDWIHRREVLVGRRV